MRVPDFILVGAHKAGTTSLHYYLEQHPDIGLIPSKGADFLSRRNFASLDDATEYLAQFDAVQDKKIVGEVSSVYLHSAGTASTIKRLFPEVKIIAVLRNPAERAYSHALWSPTYTPDELKNLDEIILNTSRFLKPGLYGKHIETYLSHFDREQVKIVLFDDFKKDSIQFVRELCDFIGVERNFTPEVSKQHHLSPLKLDTPYRKLLKKRSFVNNPIKFLVPRPIRSFILEKLLAKSTAPKPKMSAQLRTQLTDYFYDDILHLQQLTGLDCSPWLEAATERSTKV